MEVGLSDTQSLEVVPVPMSAFVCLIPDGFLDGRCDLNARSNERGSHVPVLDPKDDAEIGAAVRTRSNVRPVYVSAGHRVSLESAKRLVLECTPRYRIPEPLRGARMLC